MGNSWTQTCFEAMQAEVKPGDDILVSVSGAEMIIRYRLPGPYIRVNRACVTGRKTSVGATQPASSPSSIVRICARPLAIEIGEGPALTSLVTLSAREGADGRAVVCPLLRG
jgi:hypothetical protein